MQLRHKASYSYVRLNIQHQHCPITRPSWLAAVNPQLYFSITSSISMEHFTVQLLCQRSLPAAAAAAAFSPPSICNLCDLVQAEITHNPADLHRPQGSRSVGPHSIYRVSRGSPETTGGMHTNMQAHTAHWQKTMTGTYTHTFMHNSIQKVENFLLMLQWAKTLTILWTNTADYKWTLILPSQKSNIASVHTPVCQGWQVKFVYIASAQACHFWDRFIQTTGLSRTNLIQDEIMQHLRQGRSHMGIYHQECCSWCKNIIHSTVFEDSNCPTIHISVLTDRLKDSACLLKPVWYKP